MKEECEKEIFLDWAEKYRPKTLSQINTNSRAIKELEEWALSWLDGIPKEKAVVIHGPPGTSKTTSAYAIAKDMDWEIVELNASDQRTADIINKIVGLASINSTLDDRKRLIILDEADNLHGREDKGGEQAIIEIIKKTVQPIILIANNLYDMSPGLRNSARPIKFYPIMPGIIFSILREIADRENLSYDQGVIENLANFADGDMRAAINDLQATVQNSILNHRQNVDRDKDDNKFKLLERILQGNDIKDACNTILEVDEDPDEFIQWIDENLPIVFRNVYDLNRGYYYLSRASTFNARVYRRQDYNMWKFSGALMTAGVVVSHSNFNTNNVKFNYPSIRQRLKYTKNIRKIRDSVSKKIGMYCHVSINYARSQLLPFFKMLMNNDTYMNSITTLLSLEPEEIAFLTDTDIITEKIQGVYDNSIVENTDVVEDSISLVESPQIDKNLKKEVKKESKGQSSLFDF